MKSRKVYAELSEDQRKKGLSRAIANVYQRRGHLVAKPCMRCGDKAEKHHEDYSAPLAVHWFCPPCHRETHVAGWTFAEWDASHPWQTPAGWSFSDWDATR